MSKQQLFIVVCEDRHVDDDITVHATIESAHAKVESFKAEYDYKWTEQDYGRTEGWLRYVDTFDDGPKARIQTTELFP